MERKSSYIMDTNDQNIIKSFNHEPYTVGIEEEYMICDPSSGDLINKAHEIMGALDSQVKDRFSYELIQSEIESNTPVCANINKSIEEVLKLRNYLKSMGNKYEYKLGISGTSGIISP